MGFPHTTIHKNYLPSNAIDFVLFATVCLTIGTNKIIKTLCPIQNNQMKRSKYQLTIVAPI
jgi:hypothetical protein